MLSGTREQYNKGIASLNKHKQKGMAKIAKLEKKHDRLQKNTDRHIQKTDVKSASLKNEAARLRNKSYGRFVSKNKSEKLRFKADKLDAKADYMTSQSRSAKAKLAKNEKTAELFRKEVDKVDKILVDKGKRFIESGDWKGVDRSNYQHFKEAYGNNIKKYKPTEIDQYGRVTNMRYEV